MICVKVPSLKIALALGILAGHFWSATLANEGGLIIPDQPDSNLIYLLPQAQAGIDPSNILQVFVGNEDTCCDGISPMAGSHRIEGHTVIFDPAFDFVEGQAYTIFSRENETLASPTLTEFVLQPARESSAPQVIAIHPSGTFIPENTLRFYIHFSTPMKPHVSNKFIKLVDGDGVTDTAAFMSFKQELWSEDRKRLTLLMDPGRIKRGVPQNLTLGPALLEGNKYSIVIDKGWLSASGLQSIARFEKTFSVSPAIRTRPSTDLWAIMPPRNATRDPLLVRFDRPFDHALLLNAIRVLNAAGRIVPGRVSILDHGTTWRFESEYPWAGETFQLSVDARLEDVAGNNFRELLDHSVDTVIGDENQKVVIFKIDPAP